MDERARLAAALDPAQMVYDQLKEQAFAALDRREARYEALQSVDDVVAYQRQLHDFFLQQLGGLPEQRSPLNARLVGQIPGPGYRLEKVIFESEPQHHITASVYVPDGPGPFPAVLEACGHTTNGRMYAGYQRMCQLLATNGLIAMCYDPISQGERAQALDANGQPKYGCTVEHTLLDLSSVLLGANTARYRVYDGMRALDYLASRPDVLPQRLGCLGESGGGTLTSYLMALDPRVACAAPGCFLTSLRWLLDTRGPQDGEQNIHNDITFGMDHADYIIMRAPKPTLMLTATRDFFDIRGAWDSFRQAKRVYTRLGFPERVDLVEADLEHGLSTPLRIAAARWMRRWLLGSDEPLTEPEFPLLSEQELRCTPEGQVMRLPGERSVFQINAELGHTLAASRAPLTPETLQRVREQIGLRPAAERRALESLPVGAVQRKGYTLRRWLLAPEEGITLSALALEPPQPDGDAYLTVHSGGKEADAGPDGPLEALVHAGHLVLALDVRGVGGEAGAWLCKEGFLAYRLGRSYLGLRVEDILAARPFLAGYQSVPQPYRVHLVGIGGCGPVALHAAALEPEAFASLTLRRSLVSWANLVEIGDVPLAHLATMVHGALAVYDLPDLVASLGSKVTIEEPMDALGNPVT